MILGYGKTGPDKDLPGSPLSLEEAATHRTFAAEEMTRSL